MRCGKGSEDEGGWCGAGSTASAGRERVKGNERRGRTRAVRTRASSGGGRERGITELARAGAEKETISLEQVQQRQKSSISDNIGKFQKKTSVALSYKK